VSEIMAVAEHTASLCAGAEALNLPVDLPEPIEQSWPLAVRPVDPAPLIWRVLARMPRIMLTTWRKDRLVMSSGRLDAEAKACIAFAIACVKQSPYMVAYTTAHLRRSLDLDDQAMVELVASVMHYVSFNTISHAMLLEPARTEMRAVDFTPE
jgi:alkylhydroperoxidase/carboxymuconolactone decarboxylase family protein YurZ